MARLDKKLVAKLAKKLGKSEGYIKEQISKKAGKNSISSEAQLILWLKEEKIGSQTYFNKLSPELKTQISTFRPVQTPTRTNRP